MDGQFNAPATLPPGKRHVTHCTGGWVVLEATLDGSGKSRPHRGSNPLPSTRNESLYWLRYPGRQPRGGKDFENK